MSFGKRLRKAREAKGLTQKELANLLFLGESTISFYEADKREPKLEILEKLANALDVSVDWLLGRTNDPPIPVDAIPVTDWVRVPVYGEVRAGLPMLAREEIIGWEYVPAEDVKGGEYFYLRVKGDSMIGARIYPGDLVLVRRQDVLEDGQIGVVIVGEEATIKRIYRRGGEYILVAENPAYGPQVYPSRDVRIVGEVIEGKYKLNGRR